MSKPKVIPWNEFFHKDEKTELIKFSSASLIPTVITMSTTSDKIDTLGNTFLSLVYKAGFWIILIAGITQILRAVNDHDRKKIVETILTYTLMYGALYMLPEAMHLIDSIFNEQ